MNKPVLIKNIKVKFTILFMSSFLLTTISTYAFSAIYVLGASYVSNGPEISDPVGFPASNDGNTTSTNGDTWIALLANAVDINQPKPISSTEISLTNETATNFSRGGAEIINTQGGTGGIDRPNDAGEQFNELKTYLNYNKLADTDIFAITSFGNDILMKYEIGKQADVTDTYIDTLQTELLRIINESIILGFTNILIANMPRIDLLPDVQASFNSTDLTSMKNHVDYFNSQLNAMMTTLVENNFSVSFFISDLGDLFTNVVNNPAQYGFVDATSTLYDPDTGIAIGLDPNTVMWWDGLHPTEALHQMIADNAGEFTLNAEPSSSGGGSFGMLELLLFIFLLLIFSIKKKGNLKI